MPPRQCPERSSGYVLCDHCGKVVSRLTANRHTLGAQQTAALAAAIQLPPTPQPATSDDLDSPPLSEISLTLSEQALSDIHSGDLESDDLANIYAAPQHHPPSEDDGNEDMQMEDIVEDVPVVDAGLEGLGDDVSIEADDSLMSEEPAVDDSLMLEEPAAEEQESARQGGEVDLELHWDGLPGLVDDENEGGDDDDAGISLPTYLDAILDDLRSGTPTNTASTPNSNPPSPSMSPLPELVLLWDLKAARNRVAEGIPPSSPAWTSIKTFKLQMEVNLGANAYQKFRATFDDLNLPSLTSLRHEMYDLCGLEPELYDCCKNSCMCFVGPYADLTLCRYCQHERFKPDGRPFNQFHYVPLIPQIKALYAGPVSANAMRYRSLHEFDHFLDPLHRITDIYDSLLYQELRTSHITVNGHTLPKMYFEDPRDVLLTGLTDGFQLFRRGKHTAWPILFINNNLAPTERYQTGNCICAGLIPGPNKPKDHDSFTFVVVQELVKAAVGVKAYDAVADEMFDLRIFCPWKCGDMPAAASAFTGGKHHGALHPCRVCPIEGIRIQNSTNLNHYLPITRPPDYPPSRYDLSTLPLRTHTQWMQQAREVDQAPTQNEQRLLSQSYGINRTAITSKIPGFTFPWSIPYDFMHLLENTIKNYINLICGDFKDLGPGVESYVLPIAIWKEIGSATAISNDTIPSAFGRRIPNVAEDRSYMTAEAHLVWATLYSRILLRGRFSQNRYYTHWCRFIEIIEFCLAFESTSESRAELRKKIHTWYSEYERIFYQYNDHRLPACLLTIHAWIHIPDIIEHCGPLWAYWCWVMERFCGQLSRAVSSRKWPYSSLNRRILEIGTLHTIRHMYSLEDRLPAYTSMYNKKSFPSYHDETEFPEITLLHPRTVLNLKSTELSGLRRRIAKYLATQYNITTSVANNCIPDIAEQWGRVQIKDSDIVNSLHGYSLSEEHHRDATFIQYELVVDLRAHRPREAPVFHATTYFGQLERVFVIHLEPSEALKTTALTSLVLMDVNMCDASQDKYEFWEYEKFRYHEVINGTTLRALVGRIRDRGKWVFVQRPGTIEHFSFVV